MIAFDYGFGRDETGALCSHDDAERTAISACFRTYTEFVLSLGYARTVFASRWSAVHARNDDIRSREVDENGSPHFESSSNHAQDNQSRMNLGLGQRTPERPQLRRCRDPVLARH